MKTLFTILLWLVAIYVLIKVAPLLLLLAVCYAVAIPLLLLGLLAL